MKKKTTVIKAKGYWDDTGQWLTSFVMVLCSLFAGIVLSLFGAPLWAAAAFSAVFVMGLGINNEVGKIYRDHQAR